MVIRYEDMVSDTMATLLKVTQNFGTPICPINDVIRETQLPILQQSDTNSHSWKGSPGLWKTLFTRGTAERVRSAHFDVFEQFGYETDIAQNPEDNETLLSRWKELCR